MFLKREGFPEEDEIVVCKVTKITPYTTFVDIEEYDKQGLIHISEIKQGRIRNIRDYVEVGRIVVCKVLRVNEKSGTVELSLRRVTEREKKEKLTERKLEQISEKLLVQVAKEFGIDENKLFKEIWDKIKEEYDYLFQLFQDIVEEKYDINKLKLDKKVRERLKEVIIEKIKPKEVRKKIFFTLKSNSSEGLLQIKELLGEVKENFSNVVEDITYAGGGKYLLEAVDKDYKSLDQKLEEIKEFIEKHKEKDMAFEFNVKK